MDASSISKTNRYLKPYLINDLKEKMIFLGGPRQAGKTTVAKNLLEEAKSGIYFNWDYDDHRKKLLKLKWKDEDRILIFDELHKYKRWKNWIKGLFDVQHEKHQFLVTGSARLDVFRKGGDSLLGRYHYWRLHPFTLSEYPKDVMTPHEAFERLMKVGGFPEPFLKGDERFSRRWRGERLNLILREDIRDLENVKDIQTMSLLLELLRTRVGGPIVYSHLAQDLQVASKTVLNWVEIFERMYLLFRVKPFSKNLPRAVLKPPKIYFFDNADTLASDNSDTQLQGIRFENLVATHLLKTLHFLQDRDGYRYELRYLRDKESREVDFVVLKEGKLESLIEVKYSDEEISNSLAYYSQKLKPKKTIQIVAGLKHSYQKGLIKVLNPLEALMDIELKEII